MRPPSLRAEGVRSWAQSWVTLSTKSSTTNAASIWRASAYVLENTAGCSMWMCWWVVVSNAAFCFLKFFFFFNIYFFLVCKNKRKSALYTAAPFLHDCRFFCPPFERHWILTSDPAKILSSAAPQLFSAIINLLFLDRTSYFWTIIWLWELTTPVIFTIFWHILAQKTNK